MPGPGREALRGKIDVRAVLERLESTSALAG